MSRNRILMLVALASIGTFTVLLDPFSLDLLGVSRDVVVSVGSLAAVTATVLSLLLAARRQVARRARLSWLLAALGLLAVWLGVVYAVGHAAALGEPPGVPSAADVCFLLSYPLIAAAIALRPIQRARDIQRLPLLLDAGIVLCALLSATWSLALGPLFAHFATPPLTQIVTLAYPLADIGIASCLVLLTLRETHRQPSMVLLVLGVGIIGLADTASVVLTAAGSPSSGGPVDVPWFAGIVLIGLGAAIEQPLPAPTSPGADVGRWWQFVTPAVLILGLGGMTWLASLLMAGARPAPGETALALGLVLLVLRYALMHRETVQAHRLVLQQAADREAVHQAREEAARLEGVILTARELAHLLNNDLAIVVGSIEALRVESRSADAPLDLQDADLGLDRMTDHLRQLQQVSRIKTRQTPVGPALDLASVEPVSAASDAHHRPDRLRDWLDPRKL